MRTSTAVIDEKRTVHFWDLITRLTLRMNELIRDIFGESAPPRFARAEQNENVRSKS